MVLEMCQIKAIICDILLINISEYIAKVKPAHDIVIFLVNKYTFLIAVLKDYAKTWCLRISIVLLLMSEKPSLSIPPMS